MHLVDVCSNYFSGFNDLSNYKTNDRLANFFAVIKIISYFTIIIPCTVGFVFGISSLTGRVTERKVLTQKDEQVRGIAKEHLVTKREIPMHISLESLEYVTISNPIRTNSSKTLRPYPGDLSELEKAQIKTESNDENSLDVFFLKHPDFKVSIRRQDIFRSGSEVIVNAANTHLSGGEGIDGAIHAKGGRDYEKAHETLKNLYGGSYVKGHAAMIESGSLKKIFSIDNVIVVAGPQGGTDSKKESELFSCYFNSLALSDSQGKKSIAFPSISTGIFGFPKDRAAAISLKAIESFITQRPKSSLKTISIHFLPTEPQSVLDEYQVATTSQNKGF